MKQYVYLLILPIMFLISCSDDTVEEMGGSNHVLLERYPQEVINISMDNPESFASFNKTSVTRSSELLKDSVWSSGNGHTLIYETNEHIPTQGLMRYIYLGSILQGGSIEKQRFVPIVKPMDPITISYSFPARWVTDIIAKPSLSAQRQSLQNIMNKEGMAGKQLGSFTYNMRQFSYFEELKLAFGANVNIGGLLNIDVSLDKGKIRKKTGLFAKIVQRNYTVDMDLPADGNILLNHDDIGSVGKYDPIYISSITYGRMALISIESSESYDKVRIALQAALQAKVVNGKLSFNLEQEKILKEAEVNVMVYNGEGEGTVKTAKGWNEFQDFIIQGGRFSKDLPGDAIFYTASYLSDNSPFYSKFKIHLEN